MVLKNKGDQEFDVSGRWCAVVKLGAGGSGAGKTSPGQSEAVWGRAGRKHSPPPMSAPQDHLLVRQDRDKEKPKRWESAVIHSQRDWINLRNLLCKQKNLHTIKNLHRHW